MDKMEWQDNIFWDAVFSKWDKLIGAGLWKIDLNQK
jgi:hypothetical protein